MEEKEELIDEIQNHIGRIPPQIRYILNVLAHPRIIEYTRRYLNAMDKENKCQNYESPWNCAREAEARYENIRFGWLGGGSGIGYSEWWCEPCRKRVMNE